MESLPKKSEESENVKKTFKDVKSVDDFDFSDVELIRGETPKDIKERCLQLCKDYLSGNWMKQTVDTIEVRRISGGLTNQLYYCGITEPSTDEEVPQEVAIRLYGRKYIHNSDNDKNERLTDIVVGLTVSENGLGPKIYGIFEGGEIHKYYEHRQFKDEEQNNQRLVDQVFKKLAQIHAMDVPIGRTNNWFLSALDSQYDYAFNKFPINEMMVELSCETLIRYDLKTEIQWIQQLVRKSESPVVFTHTDYRSSNLMITKPKESDNKSDEVIVVCDYEYSAYNYRAFDFCCLMREWGRKQFDLKTVDGIPPEDSVMETLLSIYIKESQQILGESYAKNPINSTKHLIKEIKIFLMLSFLLGTLMILKNDEENGDIPLDRKLSMQFAEMSYKHYWVLKNKFKTENIY